MPWYLVTRGRVIIFEDRQWAEQELRRVRQYDPDAYVTDRLPDVEALLPAAE